MFRSESMKKNLSLLLAALLLMGALSGCDLQNRRPSSEFVPGNIPTQASIEVGTEYVPPSTEAAPVVMQVTVHDIVTDEGVYTDRYGNSYTYKYHVPYIDAESRYAQGCNTEISRRFGVEVTAQQNAMRDLSTLTVLSVDYTTRLRGEFITLYIKMIDVEGEESNAVYTLDRYRGDEVSHLAILDWAGIPEEVFPEVAMEATREYFELTYGDYTWDEQIYYNRALTRTMNEENFNVDMPMFVNEKDQLIIYATIYDLAGARHTEPILIEYEAPPTTESETEF